MEFQYISCYCLSLIWIQIIQAMQNFNTSHVTVYPNRYHTDTVTFHISIHLMLLFISAYRLAIKTPFEISIHLMLLFILYSKDSRL